MYKYWYIRVYKGQLFTKEWELWKRKMKDE